MPKNFLLLITALSLSSCEPAPRDWNWRFKPQPLTGARNFPSTKTDYGKGFKDGCSSAYQAVSKGITADINKSKFDYKRLKNGPDYQLGWWDGFEQCTYILDNAVV